MKIDAIIEARMTSKRLPGKVMLKVNNKTMLEYLIERLKRVKKIDRIAFFNLFIVILISFSAFIILLDTFKNPIEIILPGFNFILDNFYETLKDLFLFFKDLTR